MDLPTTAKLRFENILRKSENKRVDLVTLPAVKAHLEKIIQTSWKFYLSEAVVICATLFFLLWKYFNQGDCLLQMPAAMSKAFRPPEFCDFCIGVELVERLSNLTAEDFEHKYAYSGKPVIVTDALQNWTAVKIFDFWYFKDVYINAKRKRKSLSCQFFPYKSGVKNLYEALSISADRVNLKADTAPWYFGWSNCNNEVAEVLRQHYGRPYFLPLASENNAVDWIFIGGPGMGVEMHVDNVRLPSWQAQLRGAKKWILAPPPECFFQCNTFEVTVRKGEMIVIDTNRWYHQTVVAAGETSVTIGAEYD